MSCPASARSGYVRLVALSTTMPPIRRAATWSATDWSTRAPPLSRTYDAEGLARAWRMDSGLVPSTGARRAAASSGRRTWEGNAQMNAAPRFPARSSPVVSRMAPRVAGSASSRSFCASKRWVRRADSTICHHPRRPTRASATRTVATWIATIRRVPDARTSGGAGRRILPPTEARVTGYLRTPSPTPPPKRRERDPRRRPPPQRKRPPSFVGWSICPVNGPRCDGRGASDEGPIPRGGLGWGTSLAACVSVIARSREAPSPTKAPSPTPPPLRRARGYPTEEDWEREANTRRTR